MEDIIVKHLRLFIDTDVEYHKKKKNNLNTCLYSKMGRIVEEELEKKINALYSSFTESELPKSSINIVIKEIKINLESIPFGESFLRSFSYQLSAKLSEEFNNKIKEDFKEQYNINSHLYIERTCKDLKDFLFDGCIENEKEYKSLIKNYDSILDMHLQHDNNKIKTSFGFKDFLALCFSLPNAYRRFIRVFPKNIIEKTIYFLFKDDASIFYSIVNEVMKILTSIKKNTAINDTFKVTYIFTAAERSTVNSLEHIHIVEDLKNEIYASIFEHYENFGYVKRNDFLSSLLNIINVKSRNDFNLVIKDDNIVVINEDKNERIEKTSNMQESPIYELYKSINKAHSDSHDTRNLLAFLEQNNIKLKNNIPYCNTETIIALLSTINFEDLDISPLLHFTNEDIKDSYSLLRNIFKIKKKDINKHTIEFLCIHSNSKDHNADDIKKSYFLSVLKSLGETKDQLEMIKKQCEEYEEGGLLTSIISEEIKKTNVNNEGNVKCISEITNTAQQKKERESFSLENKNNSNRLLENRNNSNSIKSTEDNNHSNTFLENENNSSPIKLPEDDNHSNTFLENENNSSPIKLPEDDSHSNRLLENENNSDSIKSTEDDSHSNRLLENENNSSSIKSTEDGDEDSMDLCTNIVSRFLELHGISLQGTEIRTTDDNNIYFSPLSSYVITLLLQFKNGLSLISSFYDFLKNKEYVQDYNLPVLNKLKDEIHSFTTNIHNIEKHSQEQISTPIDTNDSFLGLNINVLQLSFKVFNKFMFSSSNDKQESKHTFTNIYIFLSKINDKKVIDPMILMKDVKKKETFNTLDEYLTDVLREEISHASPTINIGKLKIKNKNKIHLRFKNLLNNTPSDTKETHENISGNDLLNDNQKLNIDIDDIANFLQDPYNCKLSKILHLALENNDVHIVDKIVSIVSNLDTRKQCDFFKVLYNTSHEYNKIANMIILGKRATHTSTFVYNFIKGKNNGKENGNLLLPILLYLLNNKDTTGDKSPQKKDNNTPTEGNKLNANVYPHAIRNILSILHNDYKYNDRQLTTFINQEYEFYSQRDNVDTNSTNNIIAVLYLHKIVNLLKNSSLKITSESNGDINTLEQKPFNINEKLKFSKESNESDSIDVIEAHNASNKKNNPENDKLNNIDIKIHNEKDEPDNAEIHNEDNEQEDNEYKHELVKEIYIHNGGLILLYPFFVKYLSELSLWDVKKQKYVDEYAKNNAIHSLQYIISSKTNNVEWRVILNKLLCGGEYNENISSGYIFDEDKEKRKQQINKIKKLSVEIIRTCIKQWEELQKLKKIKGFTRGITIKNFKEYFLNRAAIIKVYRMTNGKDSFFSYLIELSTKIYDEEIATIPWVIDKIQLPWMKKPIHVTNLIIKYKKKK